MTQSEITTNEPQPNIFTFHFVVKASTWDEVVKLLKSELGITKKRNSSDREINNLYLVSCEIDATKLTKNFYRQIANSSKIAVHSDEKSALLYPLIIKETQMVEEKLRWLLLHVSDAIEDYVRLLGYDKNDIVEQGKLDPLTSRLSFEGMLGLLELDQSWARDGVDNERMRQLIRESSDFESFKTSYTEKTTPKTVWESISKHVLQRPEKWETISPKLKKIKKLRNKCAHFYTVSDDDLRQARALRITIMRTLSKRKTTAENMQSLAALGERIAESMQRLSSAIAPTQAALQSIATSINMSVPTAIAQLENTLNTHGVLINGLDTHTTLTSDPNQKFTNETLKSMHKKKQESLQDKLDIYRNSPKEQLVSSKERSSSANNEKNNNQEKKK